MLGGVKIPYDKGLLGHSDADVLIHAICDALLGAAGLGDIGRHFPDSDAAYKDIASLKLLAQTVALVKEKGFSVGNRGCHHCSPGSQVSTVYSSNGNNPG